MPLKDDLASAAPAKSGPPCMTCDWYGGLGKADKAAFDEYIGQPRYNRAALFRVISTKWQFRGCESSLKYHLIHHHGSR